jgi:hypothetical protein
MYISTTTEGSLMGTAIAVTNKIAQLDKIEAQFNRGIITEREACSQKVRVLGDAAELIRVEMLATLEQLGL